MASMKSRDQGDGIVLHEFSAETYRLGGGPQRPMRRKREVFEGKLDDVLNTIEGLWMQTGASVPLILKRIAKEEELQTAARTYATISLS